MKFIKNLTMTVHIPPRKPGPLSADERKQLTDFFLRIMELRPKEQIKKGEIYVANK